MVNRVFLSVRVMAGAARIKIERARVCVEARDFGEAWVHLREAERLVERIAAVEVRRGEEESWV